MARFPNFIGSIENTSGAPVQLRDKDNIVDTLLLPNATITPLVELSDDIFNSVNQGILQAAGNLNFTFRDGDGVVLTDREFTKVTDELISRFKQPDSTIVVQRQDIIGIMMLDIAHYSVNGPLTNSTTTLQDVINQAINLEKGNYIIELTYGWNHNSINNDFESVLTFDGVILGDPFGNGVTHKEEPKDSSGTGGGSGTSQQLSFSGRYDHVITVAGVKTIQLQYRTDVATNASTIWNASILIKKFTL